MFTNEHRESQAIHGTLRLSTRHNQTKKGQSGSREPGSQKFGLEDQKSSDALQGGYKPDDTDEARWQL
jgi:hypothetical protein